MELYIYKRLDDLDKCIIYTSGQKEADIYINKVILYDTNSYIEPYYNVIDNMMSDYDIYLLVREYFISTYSANIYHTNYDIGKYVFLKNRS